MALTVILEAKNCNDINEGKKSKQNKSVQKSLPMAGVTNNN